MLKKLLLLVLAVVLFAAPVVGRWLYHYEGRYRPGEVPRPELSAIEQPAPQIAPFADHPAVLTPGVVVVDLAHENRLRMTELNLLQARLSARGQRLEAADSFDELQQLLRHARSLIVVSPGKDWKADEVQAVRKFVDKGGRLLLITDPTRFVVDFDNDDYFSFDYDSPHMNTLATEFGLVFQSDYLYNTSDNAGNFRNIRLTDFAADPLTAGLKQVIFYAANSIQTDAPALIAAGGETRSSASQRADPLPVAALAAGGQVLALGDLIFLTEPYNAASDNDRFVANIADFLGGAARTYKLADFPYFFGDQVDLVYVGDPLLDSDFLTSSAELQGLFAQAGKELIAREVETDTQDTLLLGLYEEAEEVEPYLAAAQVTLLITPTETAQAPEPPVEKPRPTPTPAATETLTPTPAVTPALEISVTPEAEITPTVELSPTHKNRIAIESVGDMVLTGTSLLLLQSEGERDVLVVLARTETGLKHAVARLGSGDLQDCLIRETATPTPTVLALCPTGEVEAGQGAGGWQPLEPKPSPPPASPTPQPPATDTETVTPTVEPPPAEAEGAILVIAVDKGEGRYDSLTGAGDWQAILQARYDVTVWSLAEDGPPDSKVILEYDLVIWDFGDFDADAAMDEISDALFSLMFGEIPFVLTGAFAGGSDTEAVQRDLQVSDASHPVAKGFKEGEVIGFVPAPSGSEYAIGLMEDSKEEGYNVVMVRGPDSEEAGSPSLLAVEDEFSGLRLGLVGFPIYLLPEEAKSRLVLNLVDWLLDL